MNVRLTAKRAVQTVCAVLALPAAILCGFGRVAPLFLFFGQALAAVPGFPGDWMRSAFYRLTLRDCSPDTVIAFGTYFSRSGATVAANVCIGAYCVIGLARIGARTQIASHVEIPSGRHQHARDADGRFGESTDEEVVIGSDCWIGASAVVLANVGAGTTVGAGSIVVKEIPPGCVAAGNPARILRQPETDGAS